jgi:hypothetical protein
LNSAVVRAERYGSVLAISMGNGIPGRAPIRAADVVASGVLIVAAVIYLASFPRSLGSVDESYFLYEAKRLMDGEVMYRDVFQFITPLASYAMAALFWLFGATIATAKIGMAAVHGLTMAILYLICRRLGVRRTFAALTSVAYLAVCQPAWDYASWHWFSTLVTTLLLLILIGGKWAERPRAALVPGIVCGLLVGVQQQRGLVMAAAVGLLFLLDHLIDRRYPAPRPWSSLVARGAWLFGGILIVDVPLLVACMAAAGAEPVFYALVRFPLESYPNTFRVRWGRLARPAQSHGAFTFPILLRYLPVVLVVPVVRLLSLLVAPTGRDELRTLSTLVVFAAFSALSIAYYPDVIHIAFIAPVFLVCVAEVAEWAVAAVARPAALSRATAAVAAVAVLALFGWKLSSNLTTKRRLFPYSHETAFGRVDFATRWQPILVDKMRSLLDQVPQRELYCYPYLTSPYLMTGGNNPTPYQYFIATRSPRRHREKVLSVLSERRVPYIIGSALFMDRRDPVVKFIHQHYEPLQIPELGAHGELPMVQVYRRRDAPGPTSRDSSRATE